MWSVVGQAWSMRGSWLLFVGIVVLTWGVDAQKGQIFRCHEPCIMTIDPVVSEREQQRLVTYLETTDHTTSTSLALMKKRFLWCASATFHRIGYQLYEICARAYRPFLFVNDDLVVTDKGMVLPADWYDPESVRQVHHITMADMQSNMVLDDRSMHFLHTCYRLLDRYHLVWQGQTAIFLQDKNNKNFAILSATDQGLTEEMVAQAHKSGDEAAHALRPSKGAQLLVADVRFKNQVVTYYRHKGAEHGFII